MREPKQEGSEITSNASKVQGKIFTQPQQLTALA